MEALVEEMRPSKPKTTKSNKKSNTKPASTSDDNSDNAAAYEPGLRVPTAVLDECRESFLAADSN